MARSGRDLATALTCSHYRGRIFNLKSIRGRTLVVLLNVCLRIEVVSECAKMNG